MLTLSKWQRWADRALQLADEQQVEEEVIRALDVVRDTGAEPYFTLKAAVAQLEAKADE